MRSSFAGILVACMVASQAAAAPPPLLHHRATWTSPHALLQQPVAPAPAPAPALAPAPAVALPAAPAVTPPAAPPALAPPGLLPPAAPAVNPCDALCAEAAKTYAQYREDLEKERKAQAERIKEAGKHHAERVERLLGEKEKALASQTKDAIHAAATAAKQQVEHDLEAFATHAVSGFSESSKNILAEHHAANHIPTEQPLANADEILEVGFGKGKDVADRIAVGVGENLTRSVSNMTSHFHGALAAWENTSTVANQAATGSLGSWQAADHAVESSWMPVRRAFLAANFAKNATTTVGTQVRLGMGMAEVVAQMSEVTQTRAIRVSEDAETARRNADTILMRTSSNKELVDSLEARINEISGRAASLSSKMRRENAIDEPMR